MRVAVAVSNADEPAPQPVQDEEAKAGNEASVADPEGTIRIESLSQGTLEPVVVDSQPKEPTGSQSAVPEVSHAVAEAKEAQLESAAKEAEVAKPKPAVAVAKPMPAIAAAPASRKLEPAVRADALLKRVQTEPTAQPNRRSVMLWSIGAIGVVGLALIALRPHPEAKTSSEAATSASQQPAPVNQPGKPAQNAELSSVNPSNAEAVAPSADPSSEDTVRVGVNIRPEGARVFYRGKEVGRTPFTLELLRGERRVFEVGYPGYTTRRLVIDGTEKEISYALAPDTK